VGDKDRSVEKKDVKIRDKDKQVKDDKVRDRDRDRKGRDRDGPKADPGPKAGQPFTNSVGMKFVWIKPVPFQMGSPDGKAPGMPAEEERNDDETPHLVTLTKGYHLGATLVTQW